jgi:magnesium chelatase family protein
LFKEVPVKLISSALCGLDAFPIEVEVESFPGLPTFSIVGLPDKVVEESRDRINLAIRNLGAKPPSRFKVVVNLAPAEVKKQGSAFDLPIAIGFLLASGQIKKFETNDKIFVGELSLDGSLRYVKGILPIALLAKKERKVLIFPKENSPEVELTNGVKFLPVSHLKELVLLLEKGELNFKISQGFKEFPRSKRESEFAFIQGIELAKRALQISAAGHHHLFLYGPPGTGKTLLSRSMISILPPMEEEEVLEVTKIYSIAGLLSPENPIIFERPFRAPHHSASSTALIGGGNNLRPGEITLAHKGVLFLDELPEFHRDVIEALRQPMEEGKIQIARAQGSVFFPADFILVAASNPCPCGFLGDEEKECKCTPSMILRYRRKLSGPILDRIDLKVNVPRTPFEKLVLKEKPENIEEVSQKIIEARKIQKERGVLNGRMSLKEIEKYCQVKKEGENLLKEAMRKLALSPRAFHKILKVSRTIADLEGKIEIETKHIAEALEYQEREGDFF